MYKHAAVRYGTSTRSTIEERIVYLVYRHRHRHHPFFLVFVHCLHPVLLYGSSSLLFGCRGCRCQCQYRLDGMSCLACINNLNTS